MGGRLLVGASAMMKGFSSASAAGPVAGPVVGRRLRQEDATCRLRHWAGGKCQEAQTGIELWHR